MILGMSLSTFTSVHVIISLIAIVSGVIVMLGLLGSNRMPGQTAIFLLFTFLTSATGFLFPFTRVLPSHMVGILSLVLLAIAFLALYGMKLSGAWLGLCGDCDDLALPECIRSGDSGIPQGGRAEGIGADSN
jgi:hypothetical protein